MAETENDRLRRKILEQLYEKGQKTPNSCEVKREELIKLLSVPPNVVDARAIWID